MRIRGRFDVAAMAGTRTINVQLAATNSKRMGRKCPSIFGRTLAIEEFETTLPSQRAPEDSL